MRIVFIVIVCVQFFCGSSESYGQSLRKKYTAPPLSTEANREFFPCPDTVKFLFFKKSVDLDLMLPSWHPVIDYDEITELEGTVIPKPGSKHIDTHVSPSDFPLHHYTHDVSFNVRPDSTADNRYTNLLANRVVKRKKIGKDSYDTVLMKYVHVEWECGLGANNKINPCTPFNVKGNSCGFYSAGHERGDIIWNWPTLGDWVHVEGLWLWDRGHPPAHTEIHPARLVAVRRNLPARIKKPEVPELSEEQYTYATRIDIFASGDGGALNNNRIGVPDFVRKVKMSGKDYFFKVEHILPSPSANSELKFMAIKQKGDNYPRTIDIQTHPGFVTLSIPWKTIPDTVVFARTVYVYWDEGNGVPDNFIINDYKVILESIQFRKKKECFGKSELNVFLEAGGDWLFFNEFIDVENILDQGLGSARKKKWNINRNFVVHLPENKSFRVHAGGWEGDGINEVMGLLMNQYSPCDKATKKWVKKNLSVASPFVFKGCLDDHIGEVHAMHSAGEIGEQQEYAKYSDGRKEIDFCPCNNGKQEKIFRLKYRIQKIN